MFKKPRESVLVLLPGSFDESLEDSCDKSVFLLSIGQDESRRRTFLMTYQRFGGNCSTIFHSHIKNTNV
ncbi:unnamed protein product [Moneuplotes crassus]|uniref:Uncharacterized protein n=1 Tax=Euplotes crassus TaxID=5936 RepID=A0AAD2D805_EUPCR|nr:unnamed protein product [Moneuplotes crassus]